MEQKKDQQKTLFVTGDFVLDNHIYEGRRSHYGDNTSAGVNLIAQLGGAALVHDLLEQLLKVDKESDRKWQSVCGVDDPVKSGEAHHVNPAEQAFAFWRPSPKKAAPDKQFWRVSEAMGFGPAEIKPQCKKLAPTEITEKPEIVVFSEGGMGFRECRDNWYEDKLGGAKWIVLKTTSPVATGSLWTQLTEKHSKKLIVIVSAHELRKSPARMNAGLSWEETIEGLLREVRPEGTLAEFTRCRHLIVVFESEGALWLDMRTGFADAHACLIYESGTIEGEHDHVTEGTAFGFLSCLAAAVTWSLTLDSDKPDFPAALEGGLSAMKDLRERGHGPASDKPDGFPAKRLAEVIKKTTFCYSRALFRPVESATRSQTDSAPGWSLLRQAQRGIGPAYDLARLVLLRGPIALKNLPYLQIGNLLTADRSEVESLRTLAQVIRRYKEKDSGKKPLSIGVFGPPGAGKSFAVKELANNLVEQCGWMEFNLSQFSTPNDLNGAFHQIRDHVLQGRLPVAFFDEFDSRGYKWLQYLLAPMQDGKFQEGQLTHTLGKCIFVFAGGTSTSYDTFGPPESKDDEKETEFQRDFRLAKGPDFKSRLDAYLDVLGPNQRKMPKKPESKDKSPVEKICGRDFVIDQSDIVFPVRRALMARAQLKCGPDEKLKMDEGLVHALLHVGKYTHGNRSLEKILQPFAAARPGRLHSSLLMPVAQLAMHTDKKAFISCCTNAPEPFSPEAPLTKKQIDKIAPAIHETYRELGRKQGWKSNPDTDKNFKDLDEFYQNSNRAAASRMLYLLALIGLTLGDGDASPKEEEDVKQYLEYFLLALAEAEHEGWMEWYFAQGWHYDPVRNDDKKLQNCLLPFSKLSDKDKSKDRDTIRHYTDFARMAKMKIVLRQEQG